MPTDAEIRDILSGIPNIPKDEVPEGADEHGNVEVRRWYIQSAANPPPLFLACFMA